MEYKINIIKKTIDKEFVDMGIKTVPDFNALIVEIDKIMAMPIKKGKFKIEPVSENECHVSIVMN